MSKHLIIARHGETEGNVNQVWHGALDTPLTPRGEAQVRATAQRIRELNTHFAVDAFFVSPLPRAQSTAAAIAAAIGCTPQVDDGLREFDLGDWEGRSFQDLKDTEQLWERWKVDPHFAPPNGESPASFAVRAVAALTRLADTQAAQTVLIVTHGGIICNVLASWLGNGPSEWRNWEPHNCAITILERHQQGWQGVIVNDISHLSADDVVSETPIYAE